MHSSPSLTSRLFSISLTAGMLPASLAAVVMAIAVFAHGRVSGQEKTSGSDSVTEESLRADWLRQLQVRYGEQPGSRAVRRIVRQGMKLADRLHKQGVAVHPPASALNEVARRVADRSVRLSEDDYRELYLGARQIVRKWLFADESLGFDDLLFVKRAPGMYPHMCDQYFGWFARPGGGLFILEDFKTPHARLRCLTSSLPAGSVLRPDISYEGDRIVWAFAQYDPKVAQLENKCDKSSLPEATFYHLYESDLQGTATRRLTSGKYDDFDGRYLPDGRIVFLSTRRGQFIQYTEREARQTGEAVLPDSFMRCGGSRDRPVSVYTLHVLDRDGGVRPVSPFESFEWHPSVLPDGRIVYARWDYVDRDRVPYISLWTTLPDGSSAQAIYGNFTRNPVAMFEPRGIPGSHKIIFTASAQYAATGGSLVVLDPRYDPDDPQAMERLTPEVPFPQSERWPQHYFSNPYPLSEDLFLVSWSDQPLISVEAWQSGETVPLNGHGIYVYSREGILELLYRDPKISSVHPVPIMARAKPFAPPTKNHRGRRDQGNVLVLDVHEGLPAALRGAVRRLRIIGIPPKTMPVMNVPQLGVTEDDPGKFVMGTVAVESDGSAFFQVPAGVPFFVQALDERGMAVQTMRTAIYAAPGETLSCTGCHESRRSAPVGKVSLATRRGPQKLHPGPEGSWPLDFDRLVQPVLNRHCVQCHQTGADGSAVNLTPGFAYTSLIAYGHGTTLQSHVLKRYEQGRSAAGQCVARSAELTQLLDRGHYDVRLGDDDWERLITWMDVYAQLAGSSGRKQRDQLVQLRAKWSWLLDGER